jgi:hypothetical protein
MAHALETQLREVVEFLAHPRVDVQKEAFGLLSGLTASPSFGELSSVLRATPVGKRVALFVASPNPDIALGALRSAVNISQDSQLLDQMLDARVVDSAMQGIREPTCRFRHLYAALLANVSVPAKGAGLVVQVDEGASAGTYLRQLLELLLQPPVRYGIAEKGQINEDTFQFLASVFSNCAQLPSARTLIVDPRRGMLPRLLALLESPNEVRRLGGARLIRNLFMDAGSHPLLLAPELGLVRRVLLPIAGPEPLDDDDKAGMLPEVASALTPAKQRDPSAEVRLVLLEALLVAVRDKRTRKYFKAIKVYPLLRELHKYERAQGHEAADHLIDNDLIHFFILPEEEEAHEMPAAFAPASAARKKEPRPEPEVRLREGPIAAALPWPEEAKGAAEEKQQEPQASAAPAPPAAPAPRAAPVQAQAQQPPAASPHAPAALEDMD